MYGLALFPYSLWMMCQEVSSLSESGGRGWSLHFCVYFSISMVSWELFLSLFHSSTILPILTFLAHMLICVLQIKIPCDQDHNKILRFETSTCYLLTVYSSPFSLLPSPLSPNQFVPWPPAATLTKTECQSWACRSIICHVILQSQ